MSNKEFISLATKVAENKATLDDLAIYNAVCDALQEEQVVWLGLDEELPQMQVKSLENFWKAQSGQIRPLRLWPRIVAAASIIVVIGLGGYFYIKAPTGANRVQDQISKNDIAPGKNYAILTIGNGRVINLSASKSGIVVNSSKMTYNDGTSISGNHHDEKSAPETEIEQLTAITPKGGQYRVTLSDGTKVWLNSASKLEFPNKFVGNERRVKLTGEAYFEVVHNAGQPFRVESKGQVVEDIGTIFNINAYPDESTINTTLISGAAAVKSLTSETKILQPGQQSILANNSLKVKIANIRSVIDWKNGKFVFDDESLASIMRKVSRWYNVEIIYKEIDPELKFGGSVSRFENVSKVLDKLELTGKIHFKIDGRNIYVSK